MSWTPARTSGLCMFLDDGRIELDTRKNLAMAD